jgi:hypothetical protein
MISSIVQRDDHSPPRRVLAQQAPEECPEGGGVEDGTHHAHELPTVQTDGTKAHHRLSGRRISQDRVLDFGRYPHAASGTMLLEVTFIQTPQFDVGTTSQTTDFFTAATFSGSGRATWGRGFRNRKPKSRNSRWHCRTPRSTPYRRRRCSDNTGPSHRVAAKSKSRGLLRRSACNLRQSFGSKVRGRPDRSPSRRASRPPSSKRFTQRCTVVPFSPNSAATSRHDWPAVTSSYPCRRWS